MTDEMMTCDQYREAVAADPSFDGGAAHLLQCSACQKFRRDMQALDEKIAMALALPVPQLEFPELPELDQSNVATIPARQNMRSRWLAIAATVTLAAFLGFRMLGSDVEPSPLAEQIVAHLEHEPYALRVTDRPVAEDRLRRVVPAEVSNIDHQVGLITYAQSCVINGNLVPHLVLQGDKGPVTILLMQHESVDAAETVPGEGINGVILPVGSGSIAIIGEEDDEDVGRIGQQVVNSVTWTT